MPQTEALSETSKHISWESRCSRRLIPGIPFCLPQPYFLKFLSLSPELVSLMARPKQKNAYFQTLRSELSPHSFDTPRGEVVAARPCLCTQHPSVKAIEALLGAWHFSTALHLRFCALSVPAPVLFIAHGDSNCHTWPGNFSSPSQHMKGVRVMCSKNIGVMLKNAYFQHAFSSDHFAVAGRRYLCMLCVLRILVHL